ncbi:codanin-1 [Prorops nasuta]|uniref:codanin-1 n=1 Tax=Prorops nasuta TaxID=863751 RepID=UPI0034CF2BA9
MGELNVCFQVDTDNSENFPSSKAFCAFKKQRDCFYEILRIWEENHSAPGWLFSKALGDRIRNMLTVHNDAINYYHFARLFKSQFLISCIHKKQDEAVDDESFSFLKALKDVNPEKLTQLRKRLVTPLPSSPEALEPSFPGIQEFFRNFVVHAFNPLFYVHLENCLVYEILELNDTQFAGSEIEDSENAVDERTKQKFVTCLLSLRLLAKMLGFLVSLAYSTEPNSSKEIVAAQIEIRSKLTPPLNLQICLQNALEQGKLSMTIPWVVKYLAMLDNISLQALFYKQVLELLYYIFWAVNQYDCSAKDSIISPKSAILLKCTLNWFFKLSNIPKDLCSIWQKNYKDREAKNQLLFDKQSIQNTINLSIVSVAPVTPVKCRLDKIEIIDENVLKSCKPSMSKYTDVKAIAVKRNGTTIRGGRNKHITPVSSPLHKSESLSVKNLELQLEESFFHGQPASTRKTVDFVSERVASTCVKYICNTLLAASREANLNAFRKTMKASYDQMRAEKQRERATLEIGTIKASLAEDIRTRAGTVSKELKEQCDKVIPEICEARIQKSIDSLLPEDSLPKVKEMCIKIAIRMATERMNQWIQSHVFGGSLFAKDMDAEVNRFFKNSSLVRGTKGKKHDPDAAAPTDIINEIRSMIWDLLEDKGKNLAESSVNIILSKVKQCMEERADLLPGPERMIHTLTLDLTLFLIAYRMDIFSHEIQNGFIKVWKLSQKSFQTEPLTFKLLCPRNVILLEETKNNDVWVYYGKFIRKLLEKDIINIDTLSDQCVALFRHEWPISTFKQLSKCLTEGIQNCRITNDEAEKAKYLLGWIAETYHEMEFTDDDNFAD